MNSTLDLASSKSRIPLWVLSLAMFPLGLGGFILITGDLIQGFRSRHWEVVQGTVLSSHMSPGLLGLKQPVVRYTYRIDGAAHVSNRIWPGSIVGNLPVADPRLANTLIAKFQRGAEVPVFVNPSNPDQSALESGPDRAVLWTALFSFFMALGLWSPLGSGRWLKRWRGMAILAVCFAPLGHGHAADGDRLTPAPIKHIKPVNVEATPFMTIVGTATVRLNGILVEPQTISYRLSPEFIGNAGPLIQVDRGTYYLKVDNAPMDQAYQLRISALYNDSIVGRDGVIEKRGRSYSGTSTLRIPYGANYDIGVVFIDLR